MTVKRESQTPAESLNISLETLAFIILKARAFDAQAGVTDPDEGSNASDDRAVSVLEGQRDDPTQQELRVAIASLTEEEQVALVALTWIGRGDFDAKEWEAAKSMARERHRGPTSRYLMGMPMLGDLLEEGASALGVNLTDIEYDDLYQTGEE
ncbi:MAG: DUF3775 domain-containing protein [Alphaproteobacteria bacterium]|nr:DUF3775 domain-containing protein [Alphaproteobacteria bacterium]